MIKVLVPSLAGRTSTFCDKRYPNGVINSMVSSMTFKIKGNVSNSFCVDIINR